MLPAGQFRFCNISKVAQTTRLGSSLLNGTLQSVPFAFLDQHKLLIIINKYSHPTLTPSKLGGTGKQVNTLMHSEKHYFKEIAWLLLIKLILAITICYTFFSRPHDKHHTVQRITDYLLKSSAPVPKNQLTANRSNHD